MFKVTDYRNIEAEPVADLHGVAIRWAVNDKRDGAPTFATRIIEVEPGAATWYHAHWQEHHNYVIEGAGYVQYEGEIHRVKPGDVVNVPPNSQHQYVNDGQTTLRFICVIPLDWVRETRQR
ncbi:MAG: cupin domain-containing protein [Chloroflexi bacterium]|nr:cupin domain-containing protein [Chloroflexota bacterium]